MYKKSKTTLRNLRTHLSEDYRRVSKINSKPTFFNFLSKSFSNAGFRAVFLYRVGNFFYRNNLFFLAGMSQRLMHHFAHCWISVAAEIGPGFLVAHVSGIIIGGSTIIGRNCDIRQNVTFGGNFNKVNEKGRQQPLIGDHVSFGAGAVIVGPITIGDHVIVGANSVVSRDVPSNVIVSGVPALIIKDVWDESITGRKL
jgi:serine O-acetyltransferase